MTRSWFLLLPAFLIALLLSLALAGVALAQEPTPSDDEVNAIARQLFCPVCENVPLDVCPTQACAQWRELIRQKLSEGWSEPQIKSYFVEQYGDRVLATPPAKGFNWLVYLVPPIALLAGVYILWRSMRSWKQPPPPVSVQQAAQADAQPDKYAHRLEEELRKR
ncbi:MAG: cytochrome c-type biogenesis protein CcmH [Anaerolineales bacterium]|nr:cytochrome c-type biogenesis protein CcmH [Anaerolineales bacterium]